MNGLLKLPQGWHAQGRNDRRRCRTARLFALAMPALIAAGCSVPPVDETALYDQRQQAQMVQMLRSVQQMEAAAPTDYRAQAGNSVCNQQASQEALRQGNESFARADYRSAIPYYENAMMACPRDGETALRLARAFEALKEKDQAIIYYERAAASTNDRNSPVRQAALKALDRLNKGGQYRPFTTGLGEPQTNSGR